MNKRHSHHHEEYKPSQPIYHQPQYGATPIQIMANNNNNHYKQSQGVYQPIVIPKPSQSGGNDETMTPSITPSMTTNSSIQHSHSTGHHPAFHHHHHGNHHLLETTSQHSGQTANTLSFVPAIKYMQYSNFSNNSNSTQISSATNGTTSVHSAFSNEHRSSLQQPVYRNINIHPQPQPLQQHRSSVTSHHSASHHSDSHQHHQLIAPVQYHPFDPSVSTNSPYHTPYNQLVPRSSTGNINLLDLDAEIEDIQTKPKPKPKPNQFLIKEEDEKSSSHSNSNSNQSGKSQQLKLFGDDIRAYNLWLACHSKASNQDIVLFYVLYPKLCEYFRETVHSSRYPLPNDLRPIFIRHGAKAMTDTNNTYLSINKTNFILFWKWFKECCQIISELRNLWLPKSSGGSGSGLNFFCPRQVCEDNLMQSIEGCFGLRLSSSVTGGMVLSYVENNYTDINNKRGCKHVILIRQSNNMYLCNNQVLSLHHIIRNFVKLKFLYTPNRPIPKEKVF